MLGFVICDIAACVELLPDPGGQQNNRSEVAISASAVEV